MSTTTDNPISDNPHSDAELSAHYRSLADERVPDRLNKEVLRMATENTRRGQNRGLLGLWSKPLAWVATIGISLAIVLELSQTPLGPTAAETPMGPVHETDLADVVDAKREPQSERSVRQDFAPQALETIEEAENLVRMQSGPNPSEPDLPEPLSKSAHTGAEQQREVRRERSAYSADLAESDSSTTPASVNAMSAAESADALAGRMPQVNDSQACDETSRTSRAFWTACIKDLRSRGHTEAADREYDELLAKFPEYPLD